MDKVFPVCFFFAGSNFCRTVKYSCLKGPWQQRPGLSACITASESITNSFQGGQGIFILQGCSRDKQLSQPWLSHRELLITFIPSIALPSQHSKLQTAAVLQFQCQSLWEALLPLDASLSRWVFTASLKGARREKTYRIFSDTGEGEGPRGKGMDAPGWSGSASLCSLLWRNRSLSFHRAAPPSQASSLTTLLLFWILHQQALVGKQDAGFSELSWVTSSHLGRVGVHALCAFYNFGCLCHPACFIPGWWWVVLNRMPIYFLHRQDKLLHMGCRLFLEA